MVVRQPVGAAFGGRGEDRLRGSDRYLAGESSHLPFSPPARCEAHEHSCESLPPPHAQVKLLEIELADALSKIASLEAKFASLEAKVNGAA